MANSLDESKSKTKQVMASQQESKLPHSHAIPLEDYTDIFHQPIMLRANFYRDNVRRLMVFSILLVLIITGLIAWIIYERTHKPIVRYFATSNDGKLSLLTPLNHPNLTTSSLLNWVVEAATTAYNFNFSNYDRALKDIKIYFTDAGYQHFINSLTAAKTIDTVKSKQLIVSAIATGTPVIVQEGPTADGIYAWRVQLPMLITYQSTSDTRKQNIVLNMLVARRSTLESPKGIGIASIEVKEI
ncbi:MAG: type IVB secretion system apparatus protein IcmL/DotI [Proteobacteria bacterium]|nr:type IVB secretion system apparatus protein IcmL/DotI [Pseudomonadota bacterium]